MKKQRTDAEVLANADRFKPDPWFVSDDDVVKQATFSSVLPPEVTIAPGASIPMAVRVGLITSSIVLECISFDPASRWADFRVQPGDVATLALLFAGPSSEYHH